MIECASDLIFPESLRWHDGKLWFVDMYDGRLFSWSGDTGSTLCYSQRGNLGGIAWGAGGRMLVVSKQDRTLRDLDGAVFATLPASNSPVNDALSLLDGTILVGEYGFDLMGGEKFSTGCIFSVNAAGKVEVALEGLAFPNGMAKSPDGEVLYVAETVANCISRFEIGSDGKLTRAGTLVFQDNLQPDGIDVDKAGNIWCASRGLDAIIGYSPSGDPISHIPTTRKPADICVCGEDGSLFIGMSDGTARDLTMDPVPRTGEIVRHTFT